ncbi:MAG: AI-2E family transporter [Haloquadratum sp.]
MDVGDWGILAGDRSRAGWWLLTLGTGMLVLFALASVVDAIVLGVFVYYTMRPLYSRIHRVIGSSGVAAVVTLVGVVLPIVGLVLYVGLRAFREVLRSRPDWITAVGVIVGPERASSLADLLSALRDGGEAARLDPATLGWVFTKGRELLVPIGDVVVTLFLAVALAFFLLRDGDRLVSWCRAVVGDSEAGILRVYVRTVDHDLQSIYLGNVATAFLVGIGATVVYNGFNFLVPAAVTIPLPTMLGVLTGIASLVPLVVGKLVYVPLSLYLLFAAVESNASAFPVVVLFIVSFVFLDVLPQMVLRPYLAGRELHVGLVMFSYVVGTLVFGWYGLFLGPLVLVLGIHLLGIVVPELAHGNPVTPDEIHPSAADPDPDTNADPDPDTDADSSGGTQAEDRSASADRASET